ncbi:MAG: nitrous oxide reductase accessory protein NosL [Haliscomenobacter sp.]|nr:nitrous oxide reductase accessory protein NosL [Haliscomenobacter sp.]MBK7477054.1 nitrous oxide reductase accessory protein NosL [Haliscomenobacter sp.]MBK8879626.1 nitrous oxide reductase accessory protein NosL [Haliscomenobacter sp.]
MKNALFLLTLLLLSGCKPTAKPIEYGADVCAYCKMTIVGRQHGAEVVTKKGRVYKFDAIECLVNYIAQQSAEPFALFLVNDYMLPGELIDARTATYLISRGVPSPMGAFLSGFGDEADARAVQASKGGGLYSWEQLQRLRQDKGFLGPAE